MRTFFDLTTSEVGRWIAKPGMWILAAVCGGLVAAGGLGMVQAEADKITAGLATEDSVREYLASVPYAGALFCAVLGILIVGTDFSQNYAMRLFQRSRTGIAFAAAKTAAAMVLSLPIGAVALVAGHLVAVRAMESEGYLYAGPESFPEWVGRFLLHYVLAAAFGVGLGLLVKRTIIGVIVVFGYQTMLEPQLLDNAPDVARWLPGGAQAGIAADPYFSDPLPFAGAVGVYLAWAALLAAAGLLLVNRTRNVSTAALAGPRQVGLTA